MCDQGDQPRGHVKDRLSSDLVEGEEVFIEVIGMFMMFVMPQTSCDSL